MKTKIKLVAILIALLSVSFAFAQQDKSKRPSPPDSLQVTTTDGVTIRINYSKPSLKGRQIGTELVKYGEVWRTGANEITVLEVDKDVLVEGKALPKGKYGLWTIPTENETTLIFSKKWNGWGVGYKDVEDKLRVKTNNEKSSNTVEQFTITVDASGKVNLNWGNLILPIHIQAAK